LNKNLRSLLLVFLITLSFTTASAQEGDTQGKPTYVVQAGDTLWTIARDLYIPYDALLSENNLNENSSIIPGTELQIPGLDGMSGVLFTVDVPYGETLASFSRKYGVSEEDLIRLNRLTSPFELYVGVSAVLIGDGDTGVQAGKRSNLAPGESALELAVKENINPWALLTSNGEDGEWDLIPGEVVFIPGSEASGPGGFPGIIQDVSYQPTRFVQGHTYVIKVQSQEGTTLQGFLGAYPLKFFTKNGENYLALQGLHAKESLGLKPLSISGTLPDGTPFAHTQMITVNSGDFIYEEITGVPQETVGIEITEEETQALKVYADQASDQKLWTGKFSSPVPPELSAAFASYFGGRRSYNDSGYYYFHSGLDFFSLIGGNIYAAADGRVVYTGSLLLHGDTTMIDHGWGVYTLYAHQSEILVQAGQQVSAGDLIGRVGSTGRSTGAHMHWEVWVGGVQVDPMDWLENSYP
jgi:murein DD-endopeptidase MepM/ murein hydrolase activator NlpD